MPSKTAGRGDKSLGTSRKRKDPPTSSESSRKSINGRLNTPKFNQNKRVKIQSARNILAQTSDSALSNGEIDLKKFLAAREFEIKALDSGMRRAKQNLTTRAFQAVPREMRRRTASHNVKKVPRRLRDRAKKEMKDDNTPTVTAKTRGIKTSRGRIRADTARRLGVLAKRKDRVKEGERTKKAKIEQEKERGVIGRIPKAKRNMLIQPSKPTGKFRKRQMHKTWLPTHIWQAKRATMTNPKEPYWRFAVPLTSTEKSYRPTHRSAGQKGAMCWDMSYMATIGLAGSALALEKVLRAVGLDQEAAWGDRGRKWREGKRTWHGTLNRCVDRDNVKIGPALIIWAASKFGQQYGSVVETTSEDKGESVLLGTNNEDGRTKSKKPERRSLIIRIHPAAFLELWEEILPVSKMQRPVVTVEDLRYEIGCIEIIGPGSTEALLGIMNPFESSGVHEKTFKSLCGVTNPASLPVNSLLALSIEDPRLRYPSRKLELPPNDDYNATQSMLKTLADWPPDSSSTPREFFDRNLRHKATRLPSQKAINRRKALAPPGEFPVRVATDPSIPIVLFTTRSPCSSAEQGKWTLLAPWKCILPIWYGLVHYPLSSGGNPRFGGLQEIQQMYFEQSTPWFPGDFPGTQSGWTWEMDQRYKRKQSWERRPRGKRVEFSSLNLGNGQKGEVGAGWACDFGLFLETNKGPENLKENGEREPLVRAPLPTTADSMMEAIDALSKPPLRHLPSSAFSSLLSDLTQVVPLNTLATVRIILLSRGVPLTCARIYRLPAASSTSPLSTDTSFPNASISSPPTASKPSLRSQWLALALIPSSASSIKPKKTPSQAVVPIQNTVLGRRALALSLLRNPPLPYPPLSPSENAHPPCPGQEDLIGFVTTGSFNLAEGKGTAIGSVSVVRVVEILRTAANEKGNVKSKGGGKSYSKESRMCIVRNAGETVGRLAMWEVV